MARVLVGSGIANFDTKVDLVFPPVTLARGDSYFFFVEATPAPLFMRKQYILLVARYSSGAIVHESKLLAKFFGNGLPMIFTVPVPDLSFFPNSYAVRVVARPSEFYLGAGDFRSVGLNLFRDDAKSIKGVSSVL
jgi:hypothetical protein